MDRNTHPPIVATIVVVARTPPGVCATINGRKRSFAGMNDLFRVAVLLAGGPGGKRKGA